MKRIGKRRTPAAPLPWVGYIRVSTVEQAESGLGLASQEQKVLDAARLKELALSEVIRDEGESAKSLDRPGLKRLREMIERRQIAGFVVAKLDRLTRSLSDLCQLVELLRTRHVEMVSAAESFDTTTAAGRMILQILGVIAEWERETIRERTRDGLAQLVRRGEHAGTVRYGYRSSGLKKGLTAEEIARNGAGRMVEDEHEQAIIRRMLELRESGATMAKIAETLNAEGLRTRRKTEWRTQYVDAILRKNTVVGTAPTAEAQTCSEA